jgi:hypothetical protein
MRLSKKNTKKGYILIGIISLVSILIYFLFPILLTNNFVYDVGIISLFISLLVGNFIGIFIEKKLKRKPKRK